VTFLLTDIEGSTRLWQSYHEAMRLALARHDTLIELVVAAHDGHLVKPRGEGDSRFAVFARASDAVSAACAIQLALSEEPWALPESVRVRIGVHTGEADLRAGDYYGPAVNHCARLRAVAHGRQVIVSAVTADLVREAPPADWNLRDLGEYQLKDLQELERIWQVVHPKLQADFPPLTSMSRKRDNLPTQLNSFIGREDQLIELRRLLLGGRLLTLTGPGGIGKTRLALALADSVLPDYADGVWVIELAALHDPSLVPNAVAAALGVHEETVHSVLQETVIGSLRHRRVLLVLDNCEHLVQACAELAEVLLRACPNVRILATSREPLRAMGEATWRVTPLLLGARLDSGQAKETARSEAGRLFVERAQAAEPDFVLTEQNARAVTDVCYRLDGIPLALELAAARVRSLGIEQLAARLDDRFRLLAGGARTAPPRQRTLLATLDWSHELLTESERQLFGRLSIFGGGWTLDAAEEVCSGDALELGDIVILLGELVDKSLVVVDATSEEQARYVFLETVRQYARERLTACGGLHSTAHRHAAYYQAFAEQSMSGITGEASLDPRVVWLRRADREHDNMRAALDWAVECGEADIALRLAAALWWSWVLHLRWSEARTWLERVLALPGAQPPTALRARVLFGAAMLSTLIGEVATARIEVDECLRIAIATGDESMTLRARLTRQLVLRSGGEYAAAREEARELLADAHRAGLSAGEMRALEYVARAVAVAVETLTDVEHSIGQSANH
jgi:predicted ATPase/class 3 adenylate cyclase